MMRKTLAALAAGGAVVAAGLGSAAYGLIHAHSFVLRRRSLLVPSQGAEPLRILHISDAHTLARHTKRLAFLRDLADTMPDLVIITGDMIAEAKAIGPVLDALDKLLDVPGVFVFGSNDYVEPTFKNPFSYLAGPSNRAASHSATRRPLPWRDMRAAFVERGWVDLTNTRASLSINGWDLDFVGVDDPHMHLDRFPKPVPAAPESGPRMRIGVSHAPYQHVLNHMVSDGCSLIFAGHTHGGQVCLPPNRALVSNCDLDASLASGLFDWPRTPDSEPAMKGDGAAIAKEETGTAWVQVSAGVGSATYMPLRTFCPPEAILLDVVPMRS
ncbi:metallophosphoesterase [Trueperella pyogenes]|uniref:metallophosphoesterase n=1 Tax=Trueperella pyogenes TaxID=1661 RepID=UPI0023DDDE03|nr:metallophosphoesterase [Trueperella pyogenes]